jgi:hypothetical protein
MSKVGLPSCHAHFGELGGEGLVETGIEWRTIGQWEPGELFFIKHPYGAPARSFHKPSGKNQDGLYGQGGGILLFEKASQVIGVAASLFESVAIAPEGKMEMAAVVDYLMAFLTVPVAVLVLSSAFRFDNKDSRRREQNVIDVPFGIVLAGKLQIMEDEAIAGSEFFQPGPHQQFAFEAETVVVEFFQAFGRLERAIDPAAATNKEVEPSGWIAEVEGATENSAQHNADGIAKSIKRRVLDPFLQAPSGRPGLALEGLALFGITRSKSQFHVEQEADKGNAGKEQEEPVEFENGRKGFRGGNQEHGLWSG